MTQTEATQRLFAQWLENTGLNKRLSVVIDSKDKDMIESLGLSAEFLAAQCRITAIEGSPCFELWRAGEARASGDYHAIRRAECERQNQAERAELERRQVLLRPAIEFLKTKGIAPETAAEMAINAANGDESLAKLRERFKLESIDAVTLNPRNKFGNPNL